VHGLASNHKGRSEALAGTRLYPEGCELLSSTGSHVILANQAFSWEAATVSIPPSTSTPCGLKRERQGWHACNDVRDIYTSA
jgi:hypothetical protein